MMKCECLMRRSWACSRGMPAIRPSADIRLHGGHLREVPNSEVVASFDHLVSAAGCCTRAAVGPPVRCPSRRLRAIPKDDLLGQIDEGAQARGQCRANHPRRTEGRCNHAQVDRGGAQCSWCDHAARRGSGAIARKRWSGVGALWPRGLVALVGT